MFNVQNGLSQSLTFLPEDRRLGERDCDRSNFRFNSSFKMESGKQKLAILTLFTGKACSRFQMSAIFLYLVNKYKQIRRHRRAGAEAVYTWPWAVTFRERSKNRPQNNVNIA